MKTIIAHGAGFSFGAAGMWADEYILKQTGFDRPLCTFLPHTTDDAPRYCACFHDHWRPLGAVTRTLSLFTPKTRDFADYLCSSHIIYVGGGNTRSMLALWREWELIPILRQAYERGVILAGMSAGAICWFEYGFSDSTGSGLKPLSGLGFLPGICNPHHTGDRALAFQKVASNYSAALGIPDGSPVHFRDGSIRYSHDMQSPTFRLGRYA